MFPRAAELVALLLLQLVAALAADDLASDAAALQAFLAPFGSSVVHWNASQHPCSWTGVVCTGGRVTGLHLPGDGLRGALPAGALGGLTKLEVLSLRFNALSGPIPPDLAACVELKVINFPVQPPLRRAPRRRVLALPVLTQLNLADNRFSGRVPPSIARNGKLQQLYLNGNLLTGPSAKREHAVPHRVQRVVQQPDRPDSRELRPHAGHVVPRHVAVREAAPAVQRAAGIGATAGAAPRALARSGRRGCRIAAGPPRTSAPPRRRRDRRHCDRQRARARPRRGRAPPRVPPPAARRHVPQPGRGRGGAGAAQQGGDEPQRVHATCLQRAADASSFVRAAFGSACGHGGEEEALLLRPDPAAVRPGGPAARVGRGAGEGHVRHHVQGRYRVGAGHGRQAAQGDVAAGARVPGQGSRHRRDRPPQRRAAAGLLLQQGREAHGVRVRRHGQPLLHAARQPWLGPDAAELGVAPADRAGVGARAGVHPRDGLHGGARQHQVLQHPAQPVRGRARRRPRPGPPCGPAVDARGGVPRARGGGGSAPRGVAEGRRVQPGRAAAGAADGEGARQRGAAGRGGRGPAAVGPVRGAGGVDLRGVRGGAAATPGRRGGDGGDAAARHGLHRRGARPAARHA
ncbi:hypothetical protein PR202_ga20052 [Eleusine coracana subsp. coracana]|uniref:Leucine-rich repeat-containing N-terminal plant-type domain-containing protein n=1 Tax=Eleusine coracana subsp. coracana TaxID=191504 RepID=A0AAV5CWR4_ELECO|nr:hypothetical protein PR202_ga20052 [Eleusine coracana subsp. coracana]